jgi:hypothetical protein
MPDACSSIVDNDLIVTDEEESMTMFEADFSVTAPYGPMLSAPSNIAILASNSANF